MTAPAPLSGSQDNGDTDTSGQDMGVGEDEELLWEEEVSTLDTRTQTIGDNVVIYQLTGDPGPSSSSSIPSGVRNNPPGIFVIIFVALF